MKRVANIVLSTACSVWTYFGILSMLESVEVLKTEHALNAVIAGCVSMIFWVLILIFSEVFGLEDSMEKLSKQIEELKKEKDHA